MKGLFALLAISLLVAGCNWPWETPVKKAETKPVITQVQAPKTVAPITEHDKKTSRREARR